MKSNGKAWLVAIAIAAAGLVPSVWGQSVPALINYQGQLTGADGSPMATRDYVLEFNVFDAASGGTLIWGPQIFDGRSGPGSGPKIPVVQGWFNVMLGPVDQAQPPRSLADAFSSENRYVEIKVDGGVPIAPRQRFVSAPFALKAGAAYLASVSDNSLKLNGFDWSPILDFGNDPTKSPLKGVKPPTNSITREMLGAGSVASSNIVAGAIQTSHLADGSVTGVKIADGAVSSNHFAVGSIPLDRLARRVVGTSVGIGGVARSEAITTGLIPGTGVRVVPGLEATLETTGRPVLMMLCSPVIGAGASVAGVSRGHSQVEVGVNFYRDNVHIGGGSFILNGFGGPAAGQQLWLPASMFNGVDLPGPGSHTYSARIHDGGSGEDMRVSNVQLVAFEL